jgi:hypothetical protein
MRPLAAALLLVALAGACSPSSHDASRGSSSLGAAASTISLRGAPTSPTAPSNRRDPSESPTPAAGVCSPDTGSITIVRFPPGFVPQPRCLVIHHDQRLSVANDTDAPISVTLGSHFSATVGPHQTHAFTEPVGVYLDPGVHTLRFTPSSAADIWVDPVCQGPGATNCATA